MTRNARRYRRAGIVAWEAIAVIGLSVLLTLGMLLVPKRVMEYRQKQQKTPVPVPQHQLMGEVHIMGDIAAPPAAQLVLPPADQ